MICIHTWKANTPNMKKNMKTWVRSLYLNFNPELKPQFCHCTSVGSGARSIYNTRFLKITLLFEQPRHSAMGRHILYTKFVSVRSIIRFIICVVSKDTNAI
jgi:hypothetical protein